MTPPDIDLFTPSLTEDDDAVGFDSPWHPWSVVFAAFFCGAFGGGALMAWNFHRLGMRGRVWPCALTFAALGVAILFASVALRPDLSDPADARIARYAVRAATVLVAMGFASAQKRRFGIFTASGGEPGKLLLWGVAMFVLNAGLQIALLTGAIAVVGAG